MIRTTCQAVCVSLCLLTLAACSSLGTQQAGDQDTLAMATRVLRDSDVRANPAVEGLMQQADTL